MKYIIGSVIAIILCILAGTALMMRLGRRRKLSAPLKVLWSAVFSVLIMAAASIAYLEIYYKADDLVMDEAARDPESTVSVTKIKEGYYFDGPGESTAIIFFSGAKVQEIAYAPLMQRLAERGKDCFLVKVPFRIAFLGTGSADSIMSRYNYPEWYLAGHSMGGVAASSLAANRAEMVSGVILLASYPSAPLSDNFRMLTVYGSEDGCLDRDAYENSRTNWPKDTKEEEIEGGNHAQFGAYGEQKGDGTAQISEKEQWDQTADAIDSWIDEDSSVPEEENDSARALARRSQSKDKSDPTIYKIDSTKRAHNSEAAGSDEAAGTDAAVGSGDAAGTDAAAGSDEAAGTDAAVGSQDGSTGTNDTSVSAAPEKKNYTIMIYMVGSNLESRMGSATKDIEEIDDAGLSFDNYNVVVYTGGAVRWVSKVPCDCNCVLDMSREREERIVGRTMACANMGDPATLTAFLEFCDNNYPAEHNALIFWDHGAGPLIGYGMDEIYDSDSLMLSEMIEAMDASPFSGQKSTSFWKKLSKTVSGETESGRKLDFVGFDACLMSCLESMQVWSKYADYYVGSEELEPGDGWNYEFLKVLDEGTKTDTPAALEQQETGASAAQAQQNTESSDAQRQQDAPEAEQITSSILRTFKEYYDNKRSATNNPDLTLTCVDLTKIGAAVEALDKMARKMSSSVRGGDFSLLMKSRAQSKSFGQAKNAKGQVSYYFDLVDLWDLADQMKQMYPNEAGAVQKALDNAVIEHYTNIDHTRGISLYYPLRNKGQYSELGKYYSDMLEKSGSAQAYGSFLITSNRRWMRSKARDWTLGEPADNGKEYVLQLTQDQMDNYVGVYYSILQKDPLGGYTTRVKHCKIDPDKKGTVRLSKSLPLICARVGGYDYLLRVEQVEKDRKRSVYRTLNTALDSDVGYLMHRDDIEEMPITIQFSINKKNEIQILSVTGDDAEIGLGGKTTVEIGNWEEMSTSTVNEFAVPMRDSEGRILPFSEWSRPEVISWRDFPTDSTFELVMVNSAEMESDLVVQLEIEDINGEVYASELVPLSSSYESEQVREVEVKTRRGVLTYSVFPDHAAVVEYSGTDDKIEIPDSVEGVPVTSIDAIFSTYTLYDSNGYNAVREIVLPDTVEKIGDMAFSTCMALETVRMPENLRQIGNAAFMHCQSLRNIEIPDSVEEIGKCAFAYCRSLEEIRIPANLKRLSDGVFMGCESLEQFTGASETDACILVNGLLYTADGSELIACSASAGEETGGSRGGEEDAAKYSCKVREGTRKIGYGAFAYTYFTEVELPVSLEEIGGYAFYGCDDLAMPQLPDGIVKIGCHAFDTEAYHLRNREISSEQTVIRIPASLTDIGEHAFDKFVSRRFEVDEENLHYMSVQGSLMNKAGDACLQVVSDENGTVIIPEGTVTFSEDLLTYYLNYRSTSGLSDSERHVYLPASVTRFEDVTATSKNPESKDFMEWEYRSYLYHCPAGSAAEAYCIRKGLGFTNDMSVKTGETQINTEKGTLYFDLYEDHAMLTAYDGEDEVLELPAEAGEKALTVIGNGRESVSSEWVMGASHQCPNLRKLVIPEGVVEIRDRALCDLSFDTEILLPDSLKRLGSFAITSRVPVHLPEGLEVLGAECVRKVEGGSFVVRPVLRRMDSGAFRNTNVQKLTQEGENANYSVREGILFNADGTELVWYPFTTKSEIDVPEGVVKIGSGAFREMQSARRIVLPGSLRSIGYQAFYDCDLLEEVVFSPDNTLDEISEAAFEDCESLEKIDLPPVGTIGEEAFLDCRKLGDVSFSEGTLSIGYRAFSRTAAGDPVLPGSLQTIGSYAFEVDQRYAAKSAEVIRIPSHVTQIGDGAFKGIEFTDYEVDEKNSTYSSVDGLLLDKEKNRLISCPPGRIGTVAVPEGVSWIQAFAFSYSPGVTDLVVPDSVNYIDTVGINNITIHCSEGSYAEEYAIREGLPYVIE